MRTDVLSTVSPRRRADKTQGIGEAFMERLCGVAMGCVLLAIFGQTATQAQAVLGQGNVSCQTWTSDRQGADAAARMAWVLGYLTGYSQYGSKPRADISSGSSTEQIEAELHSHCIRHPGDDLYRASAALVEEYRRKGAR
jgi:hypothetical protein